MLKGYASPVLHIQTDNPPFELSLPGRYVVRQIRTGPKVNISIGGAFLQRFWRRWCIKPGVWLEGKKVRKEYGWPAPKIAYALVSNELEALCALSILGTFGVKNYVLHIMDLLAKHGIGSLKTSAMENLVRNAKLVQVVSPRMADEIAPWRKENVEVAPLLTGLDLDVDSASEHNNTVVMSGALLATDRSKQSFLQKTIVPAWCRFSAEVPAAKWIYTGNDFAHLDHPASGLVRNLGLLDDEAFKKVLCSATCAVLPIEHHADRWRFSVPSRLIDLLAAGVPIIAPPNEGTATGDFLQDYNGKGVIVVRNEQDCVDALTKLFCVPPFRRLHHSAARNVAKTFSQDVGRLRFMDCLARIKE
jgi:hypothetical protein